MPTFGPIIIAPTISKNKFPSSETVDSNSNLAYIKLLHSVTNEYSRTAKNIEEKVNKKLEKMQKRRSELILQVEEQKRVSQEDRECRGDQILDTKILKNSFTLIEQFNVKIRTLDQQILLR